MFRWYKHVQNLPQVQQFLKEKKRFLVQDPQPKYAFLAEKKKSKKDKKEEKKEDKKEVKAEEVKVKAEEVKVKVEEVKADEANKVDEAVKGE